MTNINCSANCVYQKEGKCCFESVCSHILCSDSNCAYFVSKEANNSNHTLSKL